MSPFMPLYKRCIHAGTFTCIPRNVLQRPCTVKLCIWRSRSVASLSLANHLEAVCMLVEVRASAAAAVMVPKKICGWRLCADYRPVNGVTKNDSYPLPLH